MKFTFQLMNETDAHSIQRWRYEGPYATYNFDDSTDDGISELLDRRSPYYAVRNEQNDLLGFFCFGTSAQVGAYDTPAIYSDNNTITIGLGLRPDLMGKGLGLDFVTAGLSFAKQQFNPATFRLFVLSWNKRAIRVYERLGFQRIRVFMQENIHGQNEFIEMSREA